MSLVQHLVALLGRIVLGSVFVWGAANLIILSWAEAVSELESRQVFYPNVLVLLAMLAMLLGGLSLVLGLRARLGAFLLVLFLVPATAILHDFWVHDPASPEYTALAVEFLKDLGLLGGLLMVLAFGPGGFSADTFLRKRPPETR